MKTVLTTTEILERKRAQYWQDAVCDTFVELDCEVRAKRPFFGELATTQCDGLHFSNVRSEGQIVKRTRTRIRRAREEVMLISLQVSGVGLVAQDGREARTSSPEILPATTARGLIRCASTPSSSSLSCICRATR